MQVGRNDLILRHFLMTLFYYFKLVKVKHRLSQARVTKRENGSIYGKKGTDQTSKQFTF